MALASVSIRTVSGVGECPECFAQVELNEVMRYEIVQCSECGADLEVLSIDPIELVLAPNEEEDWGE